MQGVIFESLAVPKQKEPILETDSMEDENSEELEPILEIDSIEDDNVERKTFKASKRECETSDACSLPATQHIQIRVSCSTI